MKEFTCIVCPMGCALRVEDKDNVIVVSGNTCARGKTYGVAEFTSPTRVVTASVKVRGGQHSVVSVKTTRPIPKDKIFQLLDTLKGIALDAPTKIGDVIIEDLFGSQVVVTSNNDRKGEDID